MNNRRRRIDIALRRHDLQRCAIGKPALAILNKLAPKILIERLRPDGRLTRLRSGGSKERRPLL